MKEDFVCGEDGMSGIRPAETYTHALHDHENSINGTQSCFTVK